MTEGVAGQSATLFFGLLLSVDRIRRLQTSAEDETVCTISRHSVTFPTCVRG